MLRNLIDAVRDSYSGAAAKQHVAAISRYHRLQASPGFRAAAAYCLDALESFAVPAEILSFPADERTSYWACRMFQEWDASAATLDLLEPDGQVRRLADYYEDKISLIQRSLPFEGEVEVAILAGGDREADYAGIDVRGKVVLAQGDIREVYRLAVQDRGAVGILYDGMRSVPPVRQRIDLPDARQYTSFWWYPGDEPKCFGFVLTPRQGDELRQRARKQSEEGEGPLRVRARVASRLYDGQVEVVSACIAGQSDEEVLMVAHLCHPQPSANDNASGAGAALEAVRTLHGLIDSGRLPQPRRSIRFLWVPEMTGTYAYLATHEARLGRMIAGINLDMVGQDQAACGSSFVVERPPEAMASFCGDLVEALREALQEGATSLSGSGDYPLYRQAVTAFSGGSDHYILSDPTVGVPTPMLIQWPDRFYHTSADTIDKVDAQMLAVVGRVATAYAYYVAAAGEPEVRWLAREMTVRAKVAVARTAQEGYTQALEAGSLKDLADAGWKALRGLSFRAQRAVEALASLRRLAPDADGAIAAATQQVREAAEAERAGLGRDLARLARGLGADGLPAWREPDDEWSRRARAMVMRRLLRGPVGQSELLARLDPAGRADLAALAREYAGAMHSAPVLALYWMDGRRSLGEISDLVECETGQRHTELIVQLAELMERAGLLERRIGGDVSQA